MNCANPINHIIKEGDNLYMLANHYHTTVPMILSQNAGIDPYNLRIGSVLQICADDNFNMSSRPDFSNSNTYNQTALDREMRLAWSQHVYWTRMVVISIAQKLSDLTATANRLMQNPADIANIYRNYYPDTVAKTIEQLLTEHLQIGAGLITALRDGKTNEANTLNKQWYANADKLASALSGINPYYDYETVKKMLYRHLELTTEEVAMRLTGNYAADINAFNKIEEEAMMMADYFSLGIMRQFPQMF